MVSSEKKKEYNDRFRNKNKTAENEEEINEIVEQDMSTSSKISPPPTFPPPTNPDETPEKHEKEKEIEPEKEKEKEVEHEKNENNVTITKEQYEALLEIAHEKYFTDDDEDEEEIEVRKEVVKTPEQPAKENFFFTLLKASAVIVIPQIALSYIRRRSANSTLTATATATPNSKVEELTETQAFYHEVSKILKVHEHHILELKKEIASLQQQLSMPHSSTVGQVPSY